MLIHGVFLRCAPGSFQFHRCKMQGVDARNAGRRPSYAYAGCMHPWWGHSLTSS